MSSQSDALDDPVFGHLEKDGAYPWWKGRMPFPRLVDCQIRWQLTPDEEIMVPATSPTQAGGGSAAVTVHDDAGDGPDDAQRAAYRSLMGTRIKSLRTSCLVS